MTPAEIEKLLADASLSLEIGNDVVCYKTQWIIDLARLALDQARELAALRMDLAGIEALEMQHGAVIERLQSELAAAKARIVELEANNTKMQERFDRAIAGWEKCQDQRNAFLDQRALKEVMEDE